MSQCVGCNPDAPKGPKAYVCYDCGTNQNLIIYHTDAKKLYGLTDNELLNADIYCESFEYKYNLCHKYLRKEVHKLAGAITADAKPGDRRRMKFMALDARYKEANKKKKDKLALVETVTNHLTDLLKKYDGELDIKSDDTIRHNIKYLCGQDQYTESQIVSMVFNDCVKKMALNKVKKAYCDRVRELLKAHGIVESDHKTFVGDLFMYINVKIVDPDNVRENIIMNHCTNAINTHLELIARKKTVNDVIDSIFVGVDLTDPEKKKILDRLGQYPFKYCAEIDFTKDKLVDKYRQTINEAVQKKTRKKNLTGEFNKILEPYKLPTGSKPIIKKQTRDICKRYINNECTPKQFETMIHKYVNSFITLRKRASEKIDFDDLINKYNPNDIIHIIQPQLDKLIEKYKSDAEYGMDLMISNADHIIVFEIEKAKRTRDFNEFTKQLYIKHNTDPNNKKAYLLNNPKLEYITGQSSKDKTFAICDDLIQRMKLTNHDTRNNNYNYRVKQFYNKPAYHNNYLSHDQKIAGIVNGTYIPDQSDELWHIYRKKCNIVDDVMDLLKGTDIKRIDGNIQKVIFDYVCNKLTCGRSQTVEICRGHIPRLTQNCNILREYIDKHMPYLMPDLMASYDKIYYELFDVLFSHENYAAPESRRDEIEQAVIMIANKLKPDLPAIMKESINKHINVHDKYKQYAYDLCGPLIPNIKPSTPAGIDQFIANNKVKIELLCVIKMVHDNKHSNRELANQYRMIKNS